MVTKKKGEISSGHSLDKKSQGLGEVVVPSGGGKFPDEAMRVKSTTVPMRHGMVDFERTTLYRIAMSGTLWVVVGRRGINGGAA